MPTALQDRARLPLLLSAAMADRFTITQVAGLAAENSARAFGHRPGRCALPHGSDTDAVISDQGETALLADRLGDGTGGSVEAHQESRGGISAVLLGGRLIVSYAELVSTGPNGTHLADVLSR